MKNFPKYNNQISTGDKRVPYVKYIIEHEFQWVLQPEDILNKVPVFVKNGGFSSYSPHWQIILPKE
jgi:hypothetical protein